MRKASPGRREPYLLYVCYEFPVLTQTFTLGEVRGLMDEGLDLQVISCRPARPDAALGPVDDVPVRNLPRAFSPGAFGALMGWLARRPVRLMSLFLCIVAARYRDQHARCWFRGLGQFLWGVRLADDLRREGRCPHLHAQFVDAASTVAFVASRLLDATFSFTNHTAYNPYLLREKLRHAALAVSISGFDRRMMSAMARGVCTDRIRVVYQGIDAGRSAIGGRTRGEATRILSVAALREKKGHHVLIRAVGLLRERGRDARLTIVGEGPERRRLKRLIDRLDLADRVSLVGAEPPERVAERMRDADVFALACVRAQNGDIDGIPISLMEAMAAGVPVVSTDISGIPELILHEEEGLLAAPGDAHMLADMLQRVVREADLSADRARRARRKVIARHDRGLSVGELADLIREVAE